MAEPPELWMFVASNVLVFILGGVITSISYRAYQRDTQNRSFRSAALGFGLITFGSLVEVIYELGIRGSYRLGGRELLALHSVEGMLIAAGLAVIFYSVRAY